MHMVGKREACSSGINYLLALIPPTAARGSFLALVARQKRHPALTCRLIPGFIWSATADGSVLRLYFNGQLIAARLGTLGAENTAPLEIGGTGSCTTFGGLIDEVNSITEPSLMRKYRLSIRRVALAIAKALTCHSR